MAQLVIEVNDQLWEEARLIFQRMQTTPEEYLGEYLKAYLTGYRDGFRDLWTGAGQTWPPLLPNDGNGKSP